MRKRLAAVGLSVWAHGVAEAQETSAEKAKHAQALYTRFKADESAQAITGPYRQLHPHDNNERQAIHEHRTAEPSPAPAAPPRAYSGAGR